jgi:hypothetical protein
MLQSLSASDSPTFEFKSDSGYVSHVPIGDQPYHIGNAFYKWNKQTNKLEFFKEATKASRDLILFSFVDDTMKTELPVKDIIYCKD